MSPPGIVRVGGGIQLLTRVLTDCFEQPVTDMLVPVNFGDRHERFVDEF